MQPHSIDIFVEGYEMTEGKEKMNYTARSNKDNALRKSTGEIMFGRISPLDEFFVKVLHTNSNSVQ